MLTLTMPCTISPPPLPCSRIGPAYAGVARLTRRWHWRWCLVAQLRPGVPYKMQGMRLGIGSCSVCFVCAFFCLDRVWVEEERRSVMTRRGKREQTSLPWRGWQADSSWCWCCHRAGAVCSVRLASGCHRRRGDGLAYRGGPLSTRG